MTLDKIVKIVFFERFYQMRQKAEGHVRQEKDEEGSFEKPVLGSMFREAVSESKAIMRKLDDYISKMKMITFIAQVSKSTNPPENRHMIIEWKRQGYLGNFMNKNIRPS